MDDSLARVKSLAGDSLQECGNGWHKCICPGHDDHNPSLSFKAGTSKDGIGTVVFKCWSGCSFEQIAKGWGKEREYFFDNYDPDKKKFSTNGVLKKKTYYLTFDAALDQAKRNAESAFRKNGTTTAVCNPQEPYRLNDGTIFGYNVRFEPVDGKKYFQPIRRVSDSKWFIGGGDEQWPPLYLPELIATAGTQFICEGEKAAAVGREAGLNTTAAQGGTQQFGKTDWLMLPPEPKCFLPDNDDSGEKFVDNVTRILQKGPEPLPITVHRIEGRPEKGGDLADLLALKETPEQKKEYVDHIQYLASLEKPFHVSPIPPADTTSVEKSLLAAWVGILQRNGNIGDTASYVNPEHFSNRDSKALAKALVSGDGQPLMAAVADLSKAASTLLDSILPLVGEAHLETFQSVAENLSASVSADYKKRAALTALKDAAEAIESGKEVSGASLRELAESADSVSGDSQIVTLKEALQQLYAPRQMSIYTGFHGLDTDAIGGLPVGLTILAATPGCGKSAMALQVAIGALVHDSDATVLWCLGEMKPLDIMTRLAALYAKVAKGVHQKGLTDAGGDIVSMNDIWNKKPEDMTPQAKATLDYVSETYWPRMKIWNGEPFSIEGIEAAVARHKPTIVVVDYLQEIKNDAKEGVEKLDDISSRLKRLALRHDTAIVGISSLSRSTDSKSMAGSIARGTSSFDYGASLIFLGSFDEEAEMPRPVKWLCKKNRNGLQQDIETVFEGNHQWFRPPGYDDDLATGFGSDAKQSDNQRDIEGFNNG